MNRQQQRSIEPRTTWRFHEDGTIPTGAWVFVFGSNLAGRHGKGAAKIARNNFHAQYGVGEGATGGAYAIPTKGRHLEPLPVDAIAASVERFLEYARANAHLDFFVTAVGTGLAKIEPDVMGAMFAQAPGNCSLPTQWRSLVEQARAEPRLAAESIAPSAEERPARDRQSLA